MGKKSKPGSRISDQSVVKATGKNWKQWFTILDAKQAARLDHPGIVALLRKYKIGGWWQQMITVSYEQARGKRVLYEKVGGFSASASKTMQASVAAIYQAWVNEKKRDQWLGDEKFVITTPRANKSLRIRWHDGTRVDIGFYPKGKNKAQIALQQDKLKSAAQAKKRKVFWKEKLELLTVILEK